MESHLFPTAWGLKEELSAIVPSRVLEAIDKADKVLAHFSVSERSKIAECVLKHASHLSTANSEVELSDFAAFGPISPGRLEKHWRRAKGKSGVHTRITKSHALAVVALMKAQSLYVTRSSQPNTFCDVVAFATRAIANSRIHDSHIDEETLIERVHPLRDVVKKFIEEFHCVPNTIDHVLVATTAKAEELAREGGHRMVSEDTLRNWIIEVRNKLSVQP